MKLIKDYAKERGVTHQAVYQMIETHKQELADYIVKQGRTRYLTTEAEKILDSYRNKSQIVLEKIESNEELERLKEENKNLLIKVAAQADKIADLSEWKSDHAVLIAEANQNKLLLEEKSKQINKIEDELHLEKNRADQLEKQLYEEQNKSFFARLFNK